MEEFLNAIFLGIVEDVNDPVKKGRIRVRVQGVYNHISTEDIPWASPIGLIDGRTFRLPAIGKLVNVVFPQGNFQEPHYIHSENYNVNLQGKLNGMEQEEYKNFCALLFDHRTQIFADDTSLTLDYKFNKITIKTDSINLELKDNIGYVYLGTVNGNQEAVLGTHYFEWMDRFIQTLLTPSSLIGNFGAPILKPQIDQLLTEYQSIRSTFVSQHVFITDNQSVTTLERETSTNMQDTKLKMNNESINQD